MIFDREGGKPQIACYDVIRNFSKAELFAVQRYRRMEGQKPWPDLALNQDVAEGKELEPKVNK